MKLFDHLIKKRVEITRVDGLLFPIFLVESPMNDFVCLSFKIERGWGNGYIGLPSWHPYYKIDYDSIPVSCHGGLTFGQLDEDEDLWVIGFDTAHSGDNKIRWSKSAVEKECKHIEEQCTNVKEAQRSVKLKKIAKINKSRKTR